MALSMMKRQVAVPLAGVAVAVAGLAGCATPFHHAANTDATQKAAATAQSQIRLTCSDQVAWNLKGEASVKALYADTGALSADASADNLPAVTKAGQKLTSDAIAAATLPLPPVGPSSWKALTAAYAAAGTAIAAGNASGAVPQLQAGNAAISAFTSAVGQCSGATL
jgi:hypothetical protein